MSNSAEATLVFTDPPKSKEESSRYGNLLYRSGHYPAGTSDCFNVGISGGCGVECFVFLSGQCDEPQEIKSEHVIQFHGKEEAEKILSSYDCFKENQQ
jgi:hypothetical protein